MKSKQLLDKLTEKKENGREIKHQREEKAVVQSVDFAV